jgi:CubicO group peptidase (beta-lactamase class C family)
MQPAEWIPQPMEGRMGPVRFLRLISLSLATALALGVAPALAQQAPQQEEELPHPKTLEELQKAMKDTLDKEHVPGAGVALVSRGQVLWCGGFGKADIAANRDVTCETQFRVGSISKTFVALALLVLQEEGKINLEARLQDVAPEVPVKNRWEAAHPVRIVNLLEHTAGFDDMELSEVYNLRNPYDYPLLNVLKRFHKPLEVRWPPGTRMAYSNPGYGAAGYLIEKLTGRPYDQYIRDTILRPMGMETADFPFTDANKALLATGYAGNPPLSVGYQKIYLRPAGDLKASPGELAKLVQFFLRRGTAGDTQLLRQESIARMEAPETTFAARHGLRLGYGLANYTDAAGGVVTHGHDGGIEGFISTYRYMPEQNWGYVVLLNSSSSGKALREVNRLAVDFLSKDFPKLQQPAISMTVGELRKFSGFYAQRAPRSQMFFFLDELTGGVRIRVVNGRLTQSGMFDKPIQLIPVGKNLFREEKEPEGSTIFFANETGNMAVSAGGLDEIFYGERSSLALAYARLALLGLCALVMATSLLIAPVWILWKIFSGMKRVWHLAVVGVPALATLSLLAVPYCFKRLSGTQIGTVNLWTVGIFLGTLLFPLLSLLGLSLAKAVPKEEIHNVVRIHSLLVSLACCTVTAFMASWGLLAVCLWAL